MGQYEHSIDPKNRINFPAKFREQLGENFILTVGLDECIAAVSYTHLTLPTNREV